MDNTLSKLANEEESCFTPTGRVKRTSGVSRAEVIAAFQKSFQLIGGVPRLAIWADANPNEFYKLYGRLLPSSSTTELDGPQEVLIRHALPPPQMQPAPQPPHIEEKVNGDQSH